MNDFALLSLLILIPIAGALVLAFSQFDSPARARSTALAASLLSALPALWVWWGFDASAGGLQFVEKHAWMPTLGVDYFLGADGLSLVMVLLTAILTPMAVLTGWDIRQNAARHFALILFLQAGLYGTFTAHNFVHWFLFWELSLIPAYFLVRLWGGPEAKKASLLFFLFTMIGSIAMLVGFMALRLETGTFDFQELAAVSREGGTGSMLIFLAVFLGFAVKAPLMPFHSWLPGTYTEAPSGVTLLLAGAMSKMGVYGFLRLLLPIFPDQIRTLLPLFLILALATIVLSAFAALVQTDIKRLLAYSSVNHVGYCLLGIFAVTATYTGPGIAATEMAATLNGVILQMFNHGITAGTLFAFAAFLESRADGRRPRIGDFGGVRRVAPVFCGLMGIAVFSSIGLPGLNGFTGEFLIFKGAFALTPWTAALAIPGLLLTAIFLLRLFQGVFDGPLDESRKGFPDLEPHERIAVIPALVLMLLIGLYPKFVIDLTNTTVLQFVSRLNP